MEDALRLALVGCGAVAGAAHVPAARAEPRVTLAALVDMDAAAAEELARRFDLGEVRIATLLEPVLPDVDAVILATPPHVRPALVETALRHGRHVLCEKPLANDAPACEKIVRLTEGSDRVVALAHSYRFWPNRQLARRLIVEGALGRVREVEVEEGFPSTWQTRSGYSMRRELVSGGCLLVNGIHTLDTLLWWFGDPSAVDYRDDAIGGLESNVRMTLQFEGGILGHYRLSRTCELANRLRVTGDHGWLEIGLHSDVFEYRLPGRTVEPMPPRAMADVWVTQLEDFVSSIIDGRPPQAGPEAGLRVARLLDACYATKRARPLPARAPLPGSTW